MGIYMIAKIIHTPALQSVGLMWPLAVASVPWCCALWIGLTRIEDYCHHWQDVVVGGLLGNVIAYSMYRLRFPSIESGIESHTATMRHDVGLMDVEMPTVIGNTNAITSNTS